MPRRSLAVLAVAALALGCRGGDDAGDPATGDVVRAPIATLDSTTATFPAALVTGVLQLRDGCLVLDTAGGPVLTLWPHDAVLVGGEVTTLVIGDREIALDGVERTYGGGFVREAGVGRELEPPLDECAERTGADDLWLFSGAVR